MYEQYAPCVFLRGALFLNSNDIRTHHVRAQPKATKLADAVLGWFRLLFSVRCRNWHLAQQHKRSGTAQSTPQTIQQIVARDVLRAGRTATRQHGCCRLTTAAAPPLQNTMTKQRVLSYQADMQEHDVLFADFELKLTERFNKGHAFDVPNCAAKLVCRHCQKYAHRVGR